MNDPQHNHVFRMMHRPLSSRVGPDDDVQFNDPASLMGTTPTPMAEPALPPAHVEPGGQLTIREKLLTSTLLAPVYMLEDLVLDLYNRSTSNDSNDTNTSNSATAVAAAATASTVDFILDTLLVSTADFRPWQPGEEVCRFDAEGNEVTIKEPVGTVEDTIAVEHELVQRFLRCGKCKKDVDIAANDFGSCEYHPGKFTMERLSSKEDGVQLVRERDGGPKSDFDR